MTKETQHVAFSQHYFLLCCYTSCPYVSPQFLLLSSVSLPFFFVPKCYSLFILVTAIPTSSLIMNKNNYVHPYFHMPKENGTEPWGGDNCMPGILLNSKIPLIIKKYIKLLHSFKPCKNILFWQSFYLFFEPNIFSVVTLPRKFSLNPANLISLQRNTFYNYTLYYYLRNSKPPAAAPCTCLVISSG